MAQRTEENDYLSVFSRPTLAPAASPVDTYVRPTLAPSRSEQLGEALSSLDALRPGLQREAKRQADRELAKGEEIFEENRADFATAVRDGTIPFGASPYVRRGYRVSQLRTLGSSYTVELHRAMESSAIHEVDDPAKVEAFIRDFTTKFEETNGIGSMPRREVDRHYRPQTVQAQQGFRQEQAQRNIALMEERRIRAFEVELFSALQTSRGGDISGWISKAAEEMYSEGIDHKIIERTIMNAVGTYAMERGSVAPVNMLGRISVAGMPPLGQGPEGRAIAGRMREAVAVRAQRAAAQGRAADAKSRKEAERDLERRIAKAYLDGDTETATALAGELVEYDPDAAYTWSQRADARSDEEDGEQKESNAAAIMGSIIAENDPEAAEDRVREAVIMGDITMSDYNALQNVMRDTYPTEPDKKPTPSVLSQLHDNPVYRDARSGLGQIVSAEDQFGMARTEARINAQKAEQALQREAVTWLQQNREPETGAYDELSFQEYIWKRSQFHTERYAPTEQGAIQDPGVPMPPSAMKP